MLAAEGSCQQTLHRVRMQETRLHVCYIWAVGFSARRVRVRDSFRGSIITDEESCHPMGRGALLKRMFEAHVAIGSLTACETLTQ